MTEQEAQAALQILNRTPMTLAEGLWWQALIDRLRQRPEPERRADAQDEGKSQTRETEGDKPMFKHKESITDGNGTR